MKTITIKQPWASLQVEGIKDIENRSWPTKFRGRVMVHASHAWTKENAEICVNNKHVRESLESLNMIHKYDDESTGYKGYSFSGLTCGVIIGSVEIVDCVINHPSVWADSTKPDDFDEFNFPIYKNPTYNWVLANPIKFTEPIPAKGKLSFWDYPYILAETEEKDGELFCHCQLPVSELSQVMVMGEGIFKCCYCGGKWYK